jgi:hypothetical protein
LPYLWCLKHWVDQIYTYKIVIELNIEFVDQWAVNISWIRCKIALNLGSYHTYYATSSKLWNLFSLISCNALFLISALSELDTSRDTSLRNLVPRLRQISYVVLNHWWSLLWNSSRPWPFTHLIKKLWSLGLWLREGALLVNICHWHNWMFLLRITSPILLWR